MPSQSNRRRERPDFCVTDAGRKDVREWVKEIHVYCVCLRERASAGETLHSPNPIIIMRELPRRWNDTQDSIADRHMMHRKMARGKMKSSIHSVIIHKRTRTHGRNTLAKFILKRKAVRTQENGSQAEEQTNETRQWEASIPSSFPASASNTCACTCTHHTDHQ
jgi:hypothetical protein